MTGPRDGEASKVGVALVDVIAGMNATIGVLIALQERERSGLGQKVESNLISSGPRRARKPGRRLSSTRASCPNDWETFTRASNRSRPSMLWTDR